MNKLILALLLSFAMTAHAQVSGPGNTFGGGGGGGIGTCSNPLPASGVCEDATGNLVLNDKGAGVIAVPADATGSEIVFSEGSDDGVNTLTLNVGSEGLATNVSCTFTSLGSLPSTCPIFKWYQPSRMAVKVITLDPVAFSSGAYDSACSALGACYVPTENVVTNGPNTLFTDPGATCTELSNTACSHPLTLGGVAETDWIVSATATVVTKGTSSCSIIVYENNANAQIHLRIDLGSSGHINAPGSTITRDNAVVTVAAGATTSYGVYRNGDAGNPTPNCQTGASFDWEVDYILEAIQQ